jgi:hypothetical protein
MLALNSISASGSIGVEKYEQVKPKIIKPRKKK